VQLRLVADVQAAASYWEGRQAGSQGAQMESVVLSQLVTV